MSDNDTPSLDPTAPPEATDDVEGSPSPARPFDGAAMAKLRWEKPGPMSLATPESQREAIAFLAKAGVREIRRLRRAGKPVPALLISATSRPLEFLLSDSLARGDLAATKKLLADTKRRRA